MLQDSRNSIVEIYQYLMRYLNNIYYSNSFKRDFIKTFLKGYSFKVKFNLFLTNWRICKIVSDYDKIKCFSYVA